MRGETLSLVIALLAAPAAVGIDGAVLDPSLTPSLPADLPDGDLLLLLAAHQGWIVERPAPVVVPHGLTLGGGVSMLAARLGAELAPADAAAYDALDPRVQAAVLPLLVAIDQAWTMRDAAFVGVQEGEAPDLPTLIAAAILVLDTAEGAVIPQVEALAQAGVWPATAVADPVGVLRLGGTGNDLETIDRILQIDPRGDDVYRNNAGGTTILSNTRPVPEPNQTYPVALSVDIEGDDTYATSRTSVQGSGVFGVGILLDIRGSDQYACSDRCQGNGQAGIGVHRDFFGFDYYECGSFCMGAASRGIGVLRDDQGNDRFSAHSAALAWGEQHPGLALLWERSGEDDYTPKQPYTSYYAAQGGANAADNLFVDEGPGIDIYAPAVVDACNGCIWRHGTPFDFGQMNGQGNDGRGGLAFVLSNHWP